MNNNQALGVMIQNLIGFEDSVAAFLGAIGKEISSVRIDEDKLHVSFTDGTGITLSDEGQSCCESRYMRSDDKLSEFVGARLLGGEVSEAPNLPAEDGEHEVAFLRLTTDRGILVVCTHNEHNGYYGGFAIQCRKEGAEDRRSSL